MSLYSIVVPVYNGEHSLPKLHQRICDVFAHLPEDDFELILVDDNSKDQSYSVMEHLHQEDERVGIVQLSRNFGQPSATLCGMSRARGDFVVTMDDDLQHRPESLPEMMAALESHPEVDVILATYVGRKHGLIRRTGTRVAKYFTSRMMGSPADLDMTSFRLMRRFICDAVLQERIYHPQIGNLLLKVSSRIMNVPVQHDARDYGKSGYSLRRLARDLIYDIMTHSSYPMTIVRNIGIGGMILGIIMGLHYFIQYLSEGSTVPGWTTLVLVTLFGFSMVLISLGIIGSYLTSILNQSRIQTNFVVRREEKAAP